MAWVHSMRWRRTADAVRGLGWINLLLTAIWCFSQANDGLLILLLGFGWAAAVMALTHGAAWAIDRHADRVVSR